MASPKQTLHPIFLKKWMGKIEDPRKLNFFTPPTALLEIYRLWLGVWGGIRNWLTAA